RIQPVENHALRDVSAGFRDVSAGFRDVSAGFRDVSAGFRDASLGLSGASAHQPRRLAGGRARAGPGYRGQAVAR
ncbi:MAG: hypothetical protein ACRCYU_20110, partial [Nocardioides sp.]